MPDSVAPEPSTFGPALDSFLDALTVALDLPGDERAEVREEIGAHLRDLRSELIEGGMTDETAGPEALRRIGPPDVLGREMTRARQTRRALLAAVGGATWAASGAAFRGLIIGIAGVTVVAVAGMLVMAVATRLFGDGTWALSDAGWYTAFGVAAFWVAAALAGRTLVSVAARRSHRPAARVRPWAAAIGGILLAGLALAWFSAPQNLFSVIALALVPAVFVAAALTGSDRPIERSRRAHVASLALLATVVVAVPLLAVVAATPVTHSLWEVRGGPYASMEELLNAKGFDLPGRFVSDPPELGDNGWTIDRGLATASFGGGAPVTARWHDLRLEAWRASHPSGQLDRAYAAPFATAPVHAQSGRLVGAVRVDRTRDVSGWELVVTGIAADGGRDLIARLGGTNSTFTGSAWDWLTAP
jgi:HAAS domain-containing protein